MFTEWLITYCVHWYKNTILSGSKSRRMLNIIISTITPWIRMWSSVPVRMWSSVSVRMWSSVPVRMWSSVSVRMWSSVFLPLVICMFTLYCVITQVPFGDFTFSKTEETAVNFFTLDSVTGVLRANSNLLQSSDERFSVSSEIVLKQQLSFLRFLCVLTVLE